MKITVDKIINLRGSFYAVYSHSEVYGKTLVDLFAYDESRGWLEADAKAQALSLASRINTEAEIREEIWSNENGLFI